MPRTLICTGRVCDTPALERTRSVNVPSSRPARTFLGGKHVSSLALDPARDRLYAIGRDGLLVKDSASTATSGFGIVETVTASVTIASARYVSLDPVNDRLYVSAYTKAYVFDRASGLDSNSDVPAPAVVTQDGKAIRGFVAVP